jgi:hypothetical protein
MGDQIMRRTMVGVWIRNLVICVMLLLGTGAAAQSLKGEVVSREIRGENDVVVIYNFSGSPGEEYEAVLYLVGGAGGRIKLAKVSGDIGEGIAPGKGKVVHWYMKSELPDPSEGVAYSFEIELRLLNRGWPWYYYAGSGVVAAGVVYAIAKPKSDGGGPVPAQPGIPLPPGGTR